MSDGYVIVAGDFVTTGGMDHANWALARYIARSRDVPLHLVAHRVDPELSNLPRVSITRVPRLLGSHFLSHPVLDIRARRICKRLAPAGFRPIVNGGNCIVPAVNWVHYVHHAFRSHSDSGWLHAMKHDVDQRRARRRERCALGNAELVIVNSERTRRDVINAFGIPGERIHTVYYGCDPELPTRSVEERRAIRARLGLPAGGPLIAFVGGLTDKRKGFDILFDAWATLCADRHWTAHLAVIGVGRQRAFWQARARENGFGDRIHFLGFRNDVPKILRACDALVSPTRYEAYGLAVHEALCLGLPAIVSESAGVAERYPSSMRDLLYDERTGSTGLAAALRRLFAHTSLERSDLNELSRRLRAHTWEDMAAQIVRLAESLPRGNNQRYA